MNIAFAGLRHDHIYMLYNEAKNNPSYNIMGAFEADPKAKSVQKNSVVSFVITTHMKTF